MRPFRFRAGVALDLRRREEEAAQRGLADARAAAEQAQTRVLGAEVALDAAHDTLREATRDGVEGWRFTWHQSWIRHRRRDADACRRTAAVSAATVDRATASVVAARQRRRALERLRDRAWRRHQAESLRHESREMNQAATLRFAAASAGGGVHGDDRSHDDATDDEPGA